MKVRLKNPSLEPKGRSNPNLQLHQPGSKAILA